MIRLAALTVALGGLSLPVWADLAPLQEGDVYCIGYDETTNTCSSVQTLKELGDGEYFILDIAGFAFNETKLDMTATLEAVEQDGRLCVKPDGVTVSMTPKDSKIAEGWQNMMQYQLNEIAAQGYCFEHKKCGADWVAIAWIDGQPRQDMSATFRIFSADDPRSQTVQPRYLDQAELTSMQKKVADQCFPTDA